MMRGFAVAGMLNILEIAATRDLVDLPTAIRSLLKTIFRAPGDLMPLLLDQDRMKKQTKHSRS
jgi:hypothetical protein